MLKGWKELCQLLTFQFFLQRQDLLYKYPWPSLAAGRAWNEGDQAGLNECLALTLTGHLISLKLHFPKQQDGASVVAQRVQLLPTTLASHIRVPGLSPTATLPIQFPVSTPGKAVEDGTHQMELQTPFFSLTQPHLLHPFWGVNQERDRRHLSFFLPPHLCQSVFHINKS